MRLYFSLIVLGKETNETINYFSVWCECTWWLMLCSALYVGHMDMHLWYYFYQVHFYAWPCVHMHQCACLHLSSQLCCKHVHFETAVVNCGTPGAPSNGQGFSSSTTYGSTVTYSCNPGFTLQGSSRSTCMANREWSEPPPSCESKLHAICMYKNIACYSRLILFWCHQSKSFQSKNKVASVDCRE